MQPRVNTSYSLRFYHRQKRFWIPSKMYCVDLFTIWWISY